VAWTFEQIVFFHVMEGAAEVGALAGYRPDTVFPGEEDEIREKSELPRQNLLGHFDPLRLSRQTKTDEPIQWIQE